MKFLYWNIKDALSDEKKAWIETAIASEQPDVLCIAEGPESINDCKTIVDFINSKGYKTYYSPTLYSSDLISNEYGWNKYGLKILLKTGLNIKTRFSFGHQKLEGRIVYLRFELAGKFYSTFLIHGMSKVGDEINQHDFICELSSFIRTKTIGKETDHVIILGDFNIEPWDDLLKKERYIYSFFYNKSFAYHSVKTNKRIYYNPVLEYLQNDIDISLIGTFYNNKYVSVLDFPLVSKEFTNYDFQILTRIGGKSLMSDTNGKYTLVDKFDHLPITLKIK